MKRRAGSDVRFFCGDGKVVVARWRDKRKWFGVEMTAAGAKRK